MTVKKGIKVMLYIIVAILGFVLVGLGLNVKNGDGKTISGKAADIFAKDVSADHDSGWWGGDDGWSGGDDGDDDGVSGATLLRSENSTR